MRRDVVFVMGSEASAAAVADTSAPPTFNSPLERGVVGAAVKAHAHRAATLWPRHTGICQCVIALCAVAHGGRH